MNPPPSSQVGRTGSAADPTMPDFPGSCVRRIREIDETDVHHLELAEITLGAMFKLSHGLCVPLSLEIASSYWDDEFDFPLDTPSPISEFAMLRRTPLPEQVDAKPRWRGESVTPTKEIDLSTAVHFVKDFLTSRPDTETSLPLGWQWINFPPCRDDERFGLDSRTTRPVRSPHPLRIPHLPRLRPADFRHLDLLVHLGQGRPGAR